MESLLTFTRDVLDPIGVWLGIVLSVPIIWTWLDLVWGRRRRHKRWHRKASSYAGTIPSVLIIDLLPGLDITATVDHYRAKDEELKMIPQDRVIKVSRDRELTPDDMPKLALDIRDAVAKILRLGTDKLHVFLAGPLCAAAMVGAELSNISCRVLLYQNDKRSSTYVNFGPLRHPYF